MDKTIWTIGHSTRTFEAFYELLHSQRITLLIDVRRFPGSRKWPHFAKENLCQLLEGKGIAYKHMEDLGGRRKIDPASENTAWRNPSFRAYADYTETQAFQQALNNLMAEASKSKTAIMCSEAVWWRCHRSIISDCLTVMGWEVLHILSNTKVSRHTYTSAANVRDGSLNYKGILGG